MIILHLHTELNLACGITKTLYLLAKNNNNETKTFVYTFGGDSVTKFRLKNLTVLLAPYKRRGLLTTIWIIVDLYNLVRKHKIHILHSHHRYFDMIEYIISKFTKVKTITSVHSKVYGKKILSYKAEQLIACSYAIRTHLMEYFKIDEERITVIHNFVDDREIDVCKFPLDLREQIIGHQSKMVIGFVGRINIEEKGIDVLLESFKQLSKKLKDITLLVVGNGSDSTFARDYVYRNKLDVVFVEAQENVYSSFTVMDIVVLPSRVDPFPLVMLEAGILKKPVVCSNVDGLVEIVEDEVTGLLVPPDDPTLLARAIFRLIENENLRTELGEALFRKVKDNYTESKCIPKYLAVYGNTV